MRRVGFLLLLPMCILGCEQRSTTDTKSQLDSKLQTHQPEADGVEGVVRRVVSERLRVNPQSLDMNKAIADELDVVQVVMTLEERFAVEIPDRVIEKHAGAKLGAPKCKPSPAQLIEIVKDSKQLAAKK
jgi:acyl carrier protein